MHCTVHACSGRLLSCILLVGLRIATLAEPNVDGYALVQLRAGLVSNVSTKRKPHIIFVLADDLGWNGVGYHANGRSTVKTPFLDRFARDGVIMDSYYVGPYCAPSRFAFLTGRAPWRSEAGYMNFRADTPIGTNPAYQMLPASLKKVGYDTHLIGKWHQGFYKEELLPTNRGFDTAFGIMESCTYHFNQQIYHGDKLNCNVDGHGLTDMMENGVPAKNYTPSLDNEILSDDIYRERAVKLIKSHDQTRGFFLYLSLQLPHEPYEVTEKYASMYNLSDKQNTYWGMHSHVDDTVKAVVDALHEVDMFGDTLLLFSSDNGADAHRFLEPYYSNYPLRGHKGQLYEGGIRVPCFVQGGFLPDAARGKTLHGLMSVSDWYATFAHLTGAELDNGGPAPHDSLNNWAYIVGEKEHSNRDEVIQHYMGEMGRQSALVWNEFKMIVYGASCGDCKSCSDCPEGITARNCTPQDPCLYNVHLDPSESTDIAKSQSHIDMVTRMKPVMESTWQLAWAQPFFGLPRPSDDVETIRKACTAWQANGGYLSPWASNREEEDFMRRESPNKQALSTTYG